MNEVIENLARFHDRRVRVLGALQLEFEGDSLWHLPKSERVDSISHRSSLWVELDEACRALGPAALRQFEGRRVIATGIVNTNHLGHFDLWPAAILVSSLQKA